eukprot:139792-Chlamydomonas_euryale.AAC.1
MVLQARLAVHPPAIPLFHYGCCAADKVCYSVVSSFIIMSHATTHGTLKNTFTRFVGVAMVRACRLQFGLA